MFTPDLISSIPLSVIHDFISVSTSPLQIYQIFNDRYVVLRDLAPNISSFVPEAPAPNTILSDDLPIALRKGSRLFTTKYPISNYVSFYRSSFALHAFSISLSFISIPKTYKHALSSSSWKSAMDEEMSVLHQNQT